MDQKREPLLSIVAPSRNDDHGGNLLGRMQLFVSGLLEQCQRHQLNAELVLVEWNPPQDRPRLAEALSWPVKDGPLAGQACGVRIIEVPAEIHRRFKHSDQLPLFQMIAKNVGIRRARGEFVLATNVDILFSDELVAFLASGKLEKGVLYRADRYDVPPDVPIGAPLDERMSFCKTNFFRICCRDGSLDLAANDFYAVHSPAHPPPPPGPLYLTYRALAALMPRPVKKPLKRLPIIREEVADLTGQMARASGTERLHTNACGDFQLMSREDWFRLRGYAELEMFSMHLDSLLCYTAYHAGIREIVLSKPCQVFHIDHSAGWSPQTERDQSLWKRLDKVGIPTLSREQFMGLARRMSREHQPVIFNDENWGLAREDLAQTTKGCAPNAR